jgi:hypothetical protein
MGRTLLVWLHKAWIWLLTVPAEPVVKYAPAPALAPVPEPKPAPVERWQFGFADPSQVKIWHYG